MKAILFALMTLTTSLLADVTEEAFGPLALDQPAAKVTELLGKPKQRGEDTFWAATGEWVQEWHYPALGLELAMASDKKSGPKRLLSITATQGCKYATKRGIAIGSSEKAVKKAYSKERDAEQSVPGESFVAGSVYGGVIFTLKAGVVTHIFIGAAAE
jgi:hypothetical protein